MIIFPLLKTEILGLLLAAVMSLTVSYASAQLIPLPPPFPSNSPQEAKSVANDTQPPKIEILTTELHEGKNVFKVSINDSSGLQVREVKYVQNGQLKVEGLFRGQNDVYNALIDIHSPSRIVTVTVGDINGNTATAFGEYDIKPRSDLLVEVINTLSQIMHYLQNLVNVK
jgi:hypothetical protein